MGWQWRQVEWHPGYKGGCIVGVHGNSGYLFEFHPPLRGAPYQAAATPATQQKPPEVREGPAVARAHLNLVARLTSGPSQALGKGDQFSYGYLGFKVGPAAVGLDCFVFYLTGGPILAAQHDAAGALETTRVEGKASTAKGESKGEENLHLVTCDLRTGRVQDHGAIFYQGFPGQPTYVNSLAVGLCGHIYAMGRQPNGLTDLFRVRIPAAVLRQARQLY